MKNSATKRKDGIWQSSATTVDPAGMRKRVYVYAPTKVECLRKLHALMDKDGAQWEIK